MYIPNKQNNESSEKGWISSLPKDIRYIHNDAKAQVLYGDEIILCDGKTSFDDCFRGTAKRDPSYEEILHLITHRVFGY